MKWKKNLFLSKEDRSISTTCNWHYIILHRHMQFRYWFYTGYGWTGNIQGVCKGFFNTKPPKARYTYTCDLNKILSYIASLGWNETLSDKTLSQNLVILLFLVNCLRLNTITSLSIQHMQADESSYTIIPAELQNYSRSTHWDISISLVAYTAKPVLKTTSVKWPPLDNNHS